MDDLDGTYGALFVGVLLSAVLFGVTVLQAFVYLQQYPADSTWRKLAVYWLWLLDALHLALSAHCVYFYLVLNYDNPAALARVSLSFKFRTVVDGLVVASVHSLYTFRLWRLLAIDDQIEPFGKEARRWSRQKRSRRASAMEWLMRRVVPWVVVTLVVIGYGIAIAMCYQTFILDTFRDLSEAPWATYIPYCFSTVVDVLIAGSLCFFLGRCRTEGGAMNGPIRTLMMYTLNTGLFTSLFSLLAIAMMVAFPRSFVSIAIELVVIKLYINSYLAMLNARGALLPPPPPPGSGARSSCPRQRHHQNQRAHSPRGSLSLAIALHDVVPAELEHKHLPCPSFAPAPGCPSASVSMSSLTSPSSIASPVSPWGSVEGVCVGRRIREVRGADVEAGTDDEKRATSRRRSLAERIGLARPIRAPAVSTLALNAPAPTPASAAALHEAAAASRSHTPPPPSSLSHYSGTPPGVASFLSGAAPTFGYAQAHATESGPDADADARARAARAPSPHALFRSFSRARVRMASPPPPGMDEEPEVDADPEAGIVGNSVAFPAAVHRCQQGSAGRVGRAPWHALFSPLSTFGMGGAFAEVGPEPEPELVRGAGGDDGDDDGADHVEEEEAVGPERAGATSPLEFVRRDPIRTSTDAESGRALPWVTRPRPRPQPRSQPQPEAHRTFGPTPRGAHGRSASKAYAYVRAPRPARGFMGPGSEDGYTVTRAPRRAGLLDGTGVGGVWGLSASE